ncbi:MAG: queuosine precursor transporter [Chloroflexi bacterium]|nr:queuosine precursor transporter [Chloroflexota bacterium]
MKSYRFLPTLIAAFVTVLIVSNIASTKILVLGPFTFDGGTLLFPLAYIFGDVLTEVYGYRASRRVIWTGFACLALTALTLAIVDALPPDPTWGLQESFHAVLGQTPRIVMASLIAYWAGEFVNSYVLAKLKVQTAGRWLWARTISSTLVGEGVDTSVFLAVAFIGIFPNDLLWAIFVSNYVFKVGVEALFTPITYQIVAFLKRVENEDYFDRDTNFNPLILE